MSYAYQSVQRPQDENQPVIHSNSNIVNITPGIHQAVSSEYRPVQTGGYPDQNIYIQHAVPNEVSSRTTKLSKPPPAINQTETLRVNTNATAADVRRSQMFRQASGESYANEDTENFNDRDDFPPSKQNNTKRRGSQNTNELPLDFNEFCYCATQKCFGWKSWAFTSYATMIVIILPLLSFACDVSFYMIAANYETSSIYKLKDPEIFNVTSNVTLNDANQSTTNTNAQLNQTSNQDLNQTLATTAPTSPALTTTQPPPEYQDNCLSQALALDIFNNSTKVAIESPFFDGQDLTYNQTLTNLQGNLFQLYQPLLIMGGLISIVWVIFYRTTIVLTEHNNIKSAFFSTLLYVVFPVITLLSLINISEYLIGDSSVKCINCRVYQNFVEGDGYDNYTVAYPNTTVKCDQKNSPVVILVVVSMALKVLDHIASGWLLLCCLSRGAFKVQHDSNIFQTTYKMGNFRRKWLNRLEQKSNNQIRPQFLSHFDRNPAESPKF